MAINVDISKITGINQVGNSYQRKSAVPLDYYSLFNTKAEAEAYAASNPVSYVGQVISYIDNGEVKVCVIANAEGLLKEVGTAPVGDNKTIEVSAEGAVALLGATSAANGTLPMLEEVDGKSQLVWKTLEDIGAGDGNDNTTYAFAYDVETQILTITPSHNGVAQTAQKIDLSAFVNTTELAEVVGKPAEGEAEATGLYKVIADAMAEAKKHADDNDANTEYHLEYDSENKKIQLIAGADSTKMFIDATPFIKDGMLHDVSYDATTNSLTFTWNTDEGEKTDVVVLSDILDPYTFEAGEKLDVAVDGAKVTYSHEEITAPTESVGSGRKYLTGVTTDGYGHITGFTTASESDQDLSGYKTKQEAYSAEGSTVKTVTKVEQNENGEIAVTYGEIAFPEFPEDKNTTYGLTDTTAQQEKVQLTLTPSEGEAQVVNVDAYSSKKVDALLQGKANSDQIPTKVSDLTNDSGYLTNVKMREAVTDGYNPVLIINKTGTDITIDDEALQNSIARVKGTADTAVQTAEFAGKAMTKEGTKVSISQKDAQDALGLKSAAYAETTAFAPANIDTGVHSVDLVTGDNNGEVKLTVDGESKNVKVKGLGSAAYTDADAYDVNGAAAEVLGKDTDAAGAATVHGALNKAKEVLGTDKDGATAMTVHGAHAAAAANAQEISKLKEDIGDLSNIMNFRGVVEKKSDSITQDVADAEIGNLKDGDVIIYGNLEYVYSGGVWHEIGDATGNATAIQGLSDRVGQLENQKPGLANNTNAGLIKGTAHTITDGEVTGTGVHIESGEVKSISTDLLVNGVFELILCGGSATN